MSGDLILFVPSYDHATGANHEIASELQREHDGVMLLGDDAIKQRLLEAIRDTSVVFAMAHGGDDRLFGQKHEIAVLAHEPIPRAEYFVFACSTARRLGPAASAARLVWWGYTSPITAPDVRHQFKALFVDIFDYLVSRFARASTLADRTIIFDELQRRCESASAVVDELAEQDRSLDVIETLGSLRDIWSKLRVLAPDVDEGHPKAPPPLLF